MDEDRKRCSRNFPSNHVVFGAFRTSIVGNRDQARATNTHTQTLEKRAQSERNHTVHATRGELVELDGRSLRPFTRFDWKLSRV